MSEDPSAGRRHPEPTVTRLPAGPRGRRRRKDRVEEGPATDAAALAQVVDRAAGRFPELAARVAAERGAAERLIARLRKLPKARRSLVVANAAAGRARAVCERLLDESRRHRHHDAAETVHWAELALAAAERYRGRDEEELRARALMERANGHRIAGDFRAAAADFAGAEELLRQDTPDPLVWADYFFLRASLAKDRRDFTAAISLLEKAVTRFRRYEETSGHARALILLGYVHGLRGEPGLGVQPTLDALELLPPAEQQMRALALGNLVHLVAESGEAVEAASLVARVKPIFVHMRSTAPLACLRFDWVVAQVERDLGNLSTAERLLKRVRASFLTRDMLHYVAVISLDLAEIYAMERRDAELRSAAAETAQICTQLGVDREAIAALGLLAQGEVSRAAELISMVAAAVQAIETPPFRSSVDGP